LPVVDGADFTRFWMLRGAPSPSRALVRLVCPASRRPVHAHEVLDLKRKDFL
jgi:hypothetical protein